MTAPKSTTHEGEYARKLALAILTTLETKGVLSQDEVNAILRVAHRSAQVTKNDSATSAGNNVTGIAEYIAEHTGENVQEQEAVREPKRTSISYGQVGRSPVQSPVVTTSTAARKGPAPLGTRWVKKAKTTQTQIALPKIAPQVPSFAEPVKLTKSSTPPTSISATQKTEEKTAEKADNVKGETVPDETSPSFPPIIDFRLD